MYKKKSVKFARKKFRERNNVRGQHRWRTWASITGKIGKEKAKKGRAVGAIREL
jgi:hypothetical protein